MISVLIHDAANLSDQLVVMLIGVVFCQGVSLLNAVERLLCADCEVGALASQQQLVTLGL